MNSGVEKWDKNSVFEQSFDFTPIKSDKNSIEYFILLTKNIVSKRKSRVF